MSGSSLPFYPQFIVGIKFLSQSPTWRFHDSRVRFVPNPPSPVGNGLEMPTTWAGFLVACGFRTLLPARTPDSPLLGERCAQSCEHCLHLFRMSSGQQSVRPNTSKPVRLPEAYSSVVVEQTTKCREAWEKASKLTSGGLGSVIQFKPPPLYLGDSKGSRVWDLDVNE
jgi:hypothetical protein